MTGYIAIRELSISGSEVARRLNIAPFAISRAMQRAVYDAELTSAAGAILRPFHP